MEKEYNKLVRDKIPNIILANKEEPIIKILDDNEYKKSLEVKLQEECNEVILASGKDRLEELADLVEVIRSLAKIENNTLDDIIVLADLKKEKRGGFENKVFLQRVITKKDN